jgi:hypothetical protein
MKLYAGDLFIYVLSWITKSSPASGEERIANRKRGFDMSEEKKDTTASAKSECNGLLTCPFCGVTPDMPTKASVHSFGFLKKDFGMTASVRCQCGVFVLGKELKSTDKLACKEAARVWNKRF